MNLVVDASVAVEYLLRTPLGERAAVMLDTATLFAPELLDAEVLAVLRREVLHARLAAGRAMQALRDVRDWQVQRVANRELLARAWRHRANVSAHDALYVATAELHDAALVTADGPLARSPALGIVIHSLRHA